MGPHDSGDGSDDQFKAGKKNGNADALPRCPTSENQSLEDSQEHANRDASSINAVTADSESIVPDMEACSAPATDHRRGYWHDAVLRTCGDLPDDKKQTQRVVVESKLFSVIEGVLHREDPMFPGRNCVVVPPTLRVALMEKAHQGALPDILLKKNVYGQLRC